MVVGIASTRKPKVDAVKAVFGRLAPKLGTTKENLIFLEFDIESGVEETPTSLERLLQGARGRGINLRNLCSDKKTELTFAVGLEGGLFTVGRDSLGSQTFLQSWAFVCSDGKEAFGASGAIPLPPSIADAVLNNHRNLSDVIDRTARQSDVRSRQGTWGILSQDLITRQASFETALTSALAPFYNPNMYQVR
jgi:non-canonical (house-cleaning) NTP pyrophosphatase